MDQNQDFDTALESFRAASEDVVRAHFDRHGYTFAVPCVETAGPGGPKYVKLWRTENDPETGEKRSHSMSIHAFVERSTGDIFKPASTKAPAKHARGNIYRDAGRSSLTEQGGIHYLR